MPKAVRSDSFKVVNLKTHKVLWRNLKEDYLLYTFSTNPEPDLALISSKLDTVRHAVTKSPNIYRDHYIVAKWVSKDLLVYQPNHQSGIVVATLVRQAQMDENQSVSIFASDSLDLTVAEIEFMNATKGL